MKDVKGLGTTATVIEAEKGIERIEKERDEVQEWFEDIVEPIFTPLLPSALLIHHRLKLFPSPTSTDSLSTRLIPEPSPFKVRERSLMSLDKSARKSKEWNESNRVVESPTMKRLVGGRRSLTSLLTEEEGERNEVFKIPLTRRLPSLPLIIPSLPITTSTTTTIGASTKLPRKQLKPLPRSSHSSALSLSTSSTTATTSKALFNRREVSTSRSRSIGPNGKKKDTASSTISAEMGRNKKRKSVSPRSKLSLSPFFIQY